MPELRSMGRRRSRMLPASYQGHYTDTSRWRRCFVAHLPCCSSSSHPFPRLGRISWHRPFAPPRSLPTSPYMPSTFWCMHRTALLCISCVLVRFQYDTLPASNDCAAVSAPLVSFKEPISTTISVLRLNSSSLIATNGCYLVRLNWLALEIDVWTTV